jgi:uncharacterized protein (TIGR00251 family)
MSHPGLSQDKDGVLLAIRVKPRGRKNAVEGWREGALLVVVTSPPSEGAANAAVLEVLSDVLQCAKSTLSVARGHKARDKQIRLTTLSIEEAAQRLSQAVPMP